MIAISLDLVFISVQFKGLLVNGEKKNEERTTGGEY